MKAMKLGDLYLCITQVKKSGDWHRQSCGRSITQNQKTKIGWRWIYRLKKIEATNQFSAGKSRQNWPIWFWFVPAGFRATRRATRIRLHHWSWVNNKLIMRLVFVWWVPNVEASYTRKLLSLRAGEYEQNFSEDEYSIVSMKKEGLALIRSVDDFDHSNEHGKCLRQTLTAATNMVHNLWIESGLLLMAWAYPRATQSNVPQAASKIY